MRKLTLVVLLAFAAAHAWAQDQSATLSWTAPTKNTDGSALTDLAGFKLYWGTTSGSYSQSVTINDPKATTYIVDGLARGTTYYFAATAVNSAGVESRFSNEASKTTAGSAGQTPAPPTGLTVPAVNETVYTLQITAERLALLAVGTAPAGTPCDGAQRVSDANGVTAYVVTAAADQITWAGAARPQTVFAQCQ